MNVYNADIGYYKVARFSLKLKILEMVVASTRKSQRRFDLDVSDIASRTVKAV